MSGLKSLDLFACSLGRTKQIQKNIDKTCASILRPSPRRQQQLTSHCRRSHHSSFRERYFFLAIFRIFVTLLPHRFFRYLWLSMVPLSLSLSLSRFHSLAKLLKIQCCRTKQHETKENVFGRQRQSEASCLRVTFFEEKRNFATTSNFEKRSAKAEAKYSKWVLQQYLLCRKICRFVDETSLVNVSFIHCDWPSCDTPFYKIPTALS